MHLQDVWAWYCVSWVAGKSENREGLNSPFFWVVKGERCWASVWILRDQEDRGDVTSEVVEAEALCSSLFRTNILSPCVDCWSSQKFLGGKALRGCWWERWLRWIVDPEIQEEQCGFFPAESWPPFYPCRVFWGGVIGVWPTILCVLWTYSRILGGILSVT